MFGYVPKNILENIFKCLVAFLKMVQKAYYLPLTASKF